ncbi:zf-HC2 domain-containing protein, partial [Streptomyces sp. JJ36]|uniref:zf-HC2 domain-containing protein n=1 Tax=Streptomyces sp. JJ36 TaxID=2736645 RepID=UPI001F31C61D
MNAAELHTLTGAYSLDALPEPERAEFERHLAGCEPCAQEVRELRATTERLGLAAAAPPPPALRRRVLEAVPAVRQEPPRVARSHRRGRGGPGGTGRGARLLPRLAL